MKKLKTYANKRFGSLSDDLKNYQHIQDPELLHHIRVEIKKIKALLNLIEFSVKKFKAHQHFIPLRTIFRGAGEIRQLDVIYRLLLRYQIAGIADAQIPNADKMNSMGVAFQKSVPQFVKLLKLEQKKLVGYYQRVTKSNARDFLKTKSTELQNLLSPRLSKTNLHKARKITKEIIYLKGVNSHRRANAFYKEVDNIIGQWHDKQLLLPVLQTSKETDEVDKLKVLSKMDLRHLKNKVRKYYG